MRLTISCIGMMLLDGNRGRNLAFGPGQPCHFGCYSMILKYERIS